MLAPGARLGPYEVLSSLGAGGMGEVYRAKDTRLDRIVALKVLPPSLAADPQFRERFDREARAISALEHPNICPLYDVGDAPADPRSSSAEPIRFLVIQYLEGETLESRLAKGPLPVPEALTIAIQIADALSTAHRAGIVHRDLKPGNIMLTKGGAKLLDFGLAKMSTPAIAVTGTMLPTTPAAVTAQGTILGTFQYMAPEQIEGLEADTRTDIFAFGAVLYEMLTGQHAFEGKTRASLIGAILKDEPPPVSRVQTLAPTSLDRVVATCLAKEPDDRWQTARDLLRELKWVSSGATVATSAPHHRRCRRRVVACSSRQPSVLRSVS
jgi:serine/threonine protein kinase